MDSYVADLEALLGVEEGDAAQRLVELRDQGAVLQVRGFGQLQVESFVQQRSNKFGNSSIPRLRDFASR